MQGYIGSRRRVDRGPPSQADTRSQAALRRRPAHRATRSVSNATADELSGISVRSSSVARLRQETSWRVDQKLEQSSANGRPAHHGRPTHHGSPTTCRVTPHRRLEPRRHPIEEPVHRKVGTSTASADEDDRGPGPAGCECTIPPVVGGTRARSARRLARSRRHPRAAERGGHA
jgi:hypothetical protein